MFCSMISKIKVATKLKVPINNIISASTAFDSTSAILSTYPYYKGQDYDEAKKDIHAC